MYDAHKTIHRYHIFAIIGNEGESKTAYVGRTKAKNPHKAFYPHRAGDVKATAYDFGPDGISDNPQFYLLEVIDCISAVAFKHIVAWYRYFEDHKFLCLEGETMGAMVDHLSPDTQQIYEKICKPVSLEEVFTREVVATTPPPEPKKNREEPKTQINLRLPSDTAEQFRDFCASSNISFGDAIARLLVAAEKYYPCAAPPTLEELKKQREQIAALKGERDELKAKATASHRKELEYRRAITDFAKQMVLQAEHAQQPPEAPPLKLEKFSPKTKVYKYPAEPGCSIVYLEGLYLGNTQAVFVVGTDTDRNKIRLRFYPQPEYVGYAPTDKRYTYWGAPWLVAYITAADGAMQMTAGMPLELLTDKPAQKDKIDDLLNNAKFRSAIQKSK